MNLSAPTRLVFILAAVIALVALLMAMNGVYQYLQDYAYETTDAQSSAVFLEMPLERRKALLDHMIAIAESDHAVDDKELRLIERTADMLGFDLRETRGG